MKKPLSPIDPAPRPTSDFSAFAICNLLLLMPHLPVTETSEIDYAAADPALLVQLADAAESTLLIIHLGTSGIGLLLAKSAMEAFNDEAIANYIETLGWLVAELNAFAEVVHKMAVTCRRLTHDYAPQGIAATIPNVKP